MSNLGTFCLLLALCLSLYGLFASLLGAASSSTDRTQRRTGGDRICASILLALVSLLYLLATSDFSVEHVAQSTSRDLPLFYKLAALWGAHDGSMLLWVFVTAVSAASLFSRTGSATAT